MRRDRESGGLPGEGGSMAGGAAGAERGLEQEEVEGETGARTAVLRWSGAAV